VSSRRRASLHETTAQSAYACCVWGNVGEDLLSPSGPTRSKSICTGGAPDVSIAHIASKSATSSGRDASCRAELPYSCSQAEYCYETIEGCNLSGECE
jgi:hypothetical protein